MQDDYYSGTTLSHHGILGMKWGVRRYQNEDGSLTKAGIKRYRKQMDKAIAKSDREGRVSNRAAVTEKYMDEWQESESSKKIEEFDKKHGINLDAEKGPVTFPVDRHGSPDRKILNQRNVLYEDYVEEGKRLVKKYNDDFASAILKDIGQEDTKQGREFLKKYYWN